MLLVGFLCGIFSYLCGGKIQAHEVGGANIIIYLFLATGANLRHSPIKVTYPHFIEKIFISPFQHQIHHSMAKRHYDKNLGAKFAIWDYFFGTLSRSKDTKEVEFGLSPEENPKYNELWKNLFMPFINFYLYIIRVFKSIKTKRT